MEHYRHELKYLIDETERASMEVRIRPVLKPDRHAGPDGYMIRSLYFDDYWDSALNEKDAGVFARRKYRIRFYNCSDSFIMLERKKKAGAYIYKEDAPLTHEEVTKIMNNDYDFLLESDNNLKREFYYECISRYMRPKVIVDYDRMPWIIDEGTVRVTFDAKVRAASCYGGDLFDPYLPTLDVMEAGKLILEVKYTEFLPQIVRSVLPPKSEELTAASKYVMCREKMQYLQGWGYWEENGGKII